MLIDRLVAFEGEVGRTEIAVMVGAVFGGGASFDDGVVYVTTGLGEVAALDADKGAVKWRVKPLGPLRGSPTVGYGSVFVVTQDNQIAALDIADGKNHIATL